MWRIIAWPFRMICGVLARIVGGMIDLLRTVIIYLSVGVFICVFAAGVWGMFEVFNNVPGKASLSVSASAAEATFSMIFSMMPWWGVAICLGIAVYLWFRHKLIGSAVAGLIAAVIASVMILV